LASRPDRDSNAQGYDVARLARYIWVILAVLLFAFVLQLITILNRCRRFPGFVYHQERFSSDHESIEIGVRLRKGSAAVCSSPVRYSLNSQSARTARTPDRHGQQ
jgi:hypothetical protein